MSEFEDKLQSILGNPEAMGQIMSIAQALTEPTSAPDPSSASEESRTEPALSAPCGENPLSLLNQIDPNILQLGMRLLSEYNCNDNRTVTLLTALQPFVSEQRFAKMDKAIQIARLSRLIRVALDSFRKGDADFV